MNTIADMRNEMDLYDHYNMSVYNFDFEIFLRKIDDAKEMHLTGDDNVYLYKIDYYKFLF